MKKKMGKWRPKRIRKRRSGSHASSVVFHRRVSKGGRPRNVVIKQFRSTEELKNVMTGMPVPLRSKHFIVSPAKAVALLKRLKGLRIPVEEVIEFDELRGRLTAKDYSKGGTKKVVSPVAGGNAPISDRRPFGRAPNRDAVVKGIFRDTAVLHSHGISVHPEFASFEPWLAFEKKKGGGWQRVLSDVGALHIGSRVEDRARHLQEMLFEVRLEYGRELARSCLKTYLKHLTGAEKERLKGQAEEILPP